MEVYAAGIGVKVVRITRGDLVIEPDGKKSAEGIVGGLDPAEGLNMNDVEGTRGFDDDGETE